jgi:hypothetical protein
VPGVLEARVTRLRRVGGLQSAEPVPAKVVFGAHEYPSLGEAPPGYAGRITFHVETA